MIASLEAYQKGASIHYFMTERKENPLFRFDKMRGELLEKNFSPLLALAKTHLKKHWIEACLSMYLPNEVIEIMKAQDIQHETHKFYPSPKQKRLFKKRMG